MLNSSLSAPDLQFAKERLLSLQREIVRNYDVDGLHLDYVRFENQFPAPYCYNASCREKFKAAHGVDPMEIDPLTEMQVAWHLWREGLVNSFVEETSKELHRIKPDLKLSAAVGSFPDDSRISLLQNWPCWVDNKWLDFLAPMSYTSDNETFRKMVGSEKQTVDDRTIVMPGLGLHLHNTVDTTLGQIDIARDMQTDGEALFPAANLTQSLQTTLASGPYADKAEVPFRRPMDRVKTLLGAARRSFRSKPGEAASYLKDAARLLGYMAYGTKAVGTVQPTRPPIFIPTCVLPIPSADVTPTSVAPVIDGRLDESFWSNAGRLEILYTSMGDPAPVSTEVRLAYDGASLYIGYVAGEPLMSSLKAAVTNRDGPVFYDDSAEFFLDPWNKRRDYFQMAANTFGTQFDAKVNNAAANLGWQSAARRDANGWTIEIAIPYASIGVQPPKPGETWSANFGRNRWVRGNPEFLIWSVPYGSFHRPERFGAVIFR